MGSSQFISKFTVPEWCDRRCDGLIRFSRSLLPIGASLPIILYGGILFVAKPVQAEAPNISVLKAAKLKAAKAHSPGEALRVESSIVRQFQPHSIGPEGQSIGANSPQPATADRPLLTASPKKYRAADLASTADLLASVDSHKAADLMGLPGEAGAIAPANGPFAPVPTWEIADISVPSFEPHPLNLAPDTSPVEWAIATVSLPSMTANLAVSEDPLTAGLTPTLASATEPLPESPIEPTIERTIGPSAVAVPPAALVPRIAADPGNPVPLPVPDTCPNFDPELGCLRLQEPFFPGAVAAKSPVLFLVPRIDFFRSNNVLLGIDPVDDGLMRPSLGLLALPPIGPRTFLVASIDVGFSRYFKVPQFNYDELRIRAGIFHQLSPVMWGEIGWTNQQLFISGNEIPGFSSGTRFLNDHALRLELSRRDQLAKRLSLSSLYQLRVGFATPEERSRVLNILYLSLNYDFTPNLQAGIDYQLAATVFTVTPRTDIYHQLLGRLTVNTLRTLQISLYGGASFGSSTEAGLDFNSFVFGVSMALNLAIF